MTLYEVIKQATEEKPDDIAYEYFRYKVTYDDFFYEIDRVADALTMSGFKLGDRIGVCMVNSPELITLFYAINRIGAVAVMLNPKSHGNELKRQIEMTEIKTVFYSDVAIKNILEYVNLTYKKKKIGIVRARTCKHLPLNLKIGVKKKMFPYNKMHKEIRDKITIQYYWDYKEFASEVRTNNEPTENYVKDDTLPAVILFSGGTTGELKAIVHSSRALNEAAKYCLQTEEPLPKNLSMLAVLPAFHIFGLTVAIHLPFVAKGKVILMPFFHADTLCKRFIKEAPTFMPGVPTMFERMLRCKRLKRANRRRAINTTAFRHGFVGGDTLSPKVRDEFNNLLRRNGSDGYISMGYGMTECCPISVNNREVFEDNCIGYVFPTNEVKICKFGTNEEVADGEKGEICVISKANMLYAFTENGTTIKPQDVDGVSVLHTEDIGYKKDGKVYYDCRMRRLIKVSGHTIFASAVEKVIEQQEDVKKAYVVAVPHKTRGQGVFAYIVTNTKKNKKELKKIYEQIEIACKSELIPYAIPIGYASLNEEEVPKTHLMKTAWGKLQENAEIIMKEQFD